VISKNDKRGGGEKSPIPMGEIDGHKRQKVDNDFEFPIPDAIKVSRHKTTSLPLYNYPG